MKLILTPLFLLAFVTFSQNNCVNDVSTDPDDPSSSILPNTDTQSDPYTSDDPRYVNNDFDWTSESPIILQNMQYDQEMLYLHNESAPYYTYIYNGEEMTPENGWELMLYNVGTYPDGTDNPDGQSSDIPYIVLYNKFTGILRVFAVYGEGYLPTTLSFDGVLVTLQYDDLQEVNSMLRLTPGGDVALDKQTSSLQSSSNAFHTNSPHKWFSTDFQLAYDPCVCYYPSKLRLKFDFLESMELELFGRSITVSDNIADGNNLLENDFLSNFQINGSDFDDQIVLYDVMEDFVDDYIGRMQKYKSELASVQEHNKQVEQNLFIANLFKGVVIEGATFAVSSFINKAWYIAGAAFSDDFFPPDSTDTVMIDKYTKKLSSYASKLFGQAADSFIKKNFEKKSNPAKPQPPMASFTEMRMSGVISNNTSIYGSNFYSPGTYGSEGTGSPTIVNPLQYPIYNNATGVFALLNSPKIKAHATPGAMNNEYYLGGRQYSSWNRNYQFQLDNDIYYAMNDLNIRSHDVSVSFRIKGEFGRMNLNVIESSAFIDDPNTMNLVSLDVNTDEYYPIHVEDGLGFNGGSNYCGGSPEQQGLCTYVQYDLPNYSYDKDTVTFTSDYFPLDAVSPIVFSVGIMNQFFKYYTQSKVLIDPLADGYFLEDINVEMLLRVNVEFDQLDQNGEYVTEILEFAYDVDDIDWVSTPIQNDIPNSTVNYDSYQENLVLNTIDFDGSPVDGCMLNGTHYTCHGWDDVTIVGDLTTSNGHTVDIFGANEVTVVGESNISPEIVLDIQTLLDYTEPMPKADADFVRDYCKNELGEGFPTYEADKPNKNALQEYEAFHYTSQSDDQFELLSVHLYPVPTSAVLYLSTTEALSNEQIVVVDLSGRTIQLPVRQIDDRSFEINTSGLSAGSYYLSLTSNEGQAKKMFTVATN